MLKTVLVLLGVERRSGKEGSDGYHLVKMVTDTGDQVNFYSKLDAKAFEGLKQFTKAEVGLKLTAFNSRPNLELVEIKPAA